MKKLLIIVLSFTITIGAMAQTFITQYKPYGGKLWGYINQNGETVIEPIYKKCYKFSESGLAPIYESKKFSFINTKGEKITTEINGFKLIEGFVGFGGLEGYNDGLVAVMKDKKWGFLDTEGNIVIELKYDKVGIFNNGASIAKIGTDFFILRKNGEETQIVAEDIVDVKHIINGFAPYANSAKQSGFIGANGKVIIPAKFASVGYFTDELAWAKTADKKLGYINKTGEWIIEPQFLAAKDFGIVSGLARVKTASGWTYVNKAGEIININDTEVWGDFSDGLAKGKKAGKTGYYNNKGVWIIAPELEAGKDFKNGFAAVKKGGKWGFVNTSGEWVIEAQFAGVKDLERVD